MSSLECLRMATAFTIILGFVTVGCAHRTEWTSSDRLIEGVTAIPPLLSHEAKGTWHVEWHHDEGVSTCSLWARDAERAQVVAALLEGSQIPFSCPLDVISGRVTLRLHRVSVLDALNICLRDIERIAVVTRQPLPYMTIQDTPEQQGSGEDASTTPASLIKSLTPEHCAAGMLVGSLFKGTSNAQGLLASQAIPLEVAVSPDANRLYLRGPADTVERALHMTRQADQKPSALRIEVFSYVQRPDQDAFITSANWQLNQGPISLQWDPGLLANGLAPLGVNVLPQTYHDLNGSLKALHQRVRAEFLSRAEAVVASGQSFSLVVGKMGFITIPQYQNGTPTAITRSIPFGNNLQITPRLLPDGSVRLRISVETSKLANRKNLTGNKNLSQRSVIVQVPQESLVLIGGMQRPVSGYSLVNGLSGLRRLPIVGKLLGAYVEDEELEQVLTILRVSVAGETLVPVSDVLRSVEIPVCDESEGIINVP